MTKYPTIFLDVIFADKLLLPDSLLFRKTRSEESLFFKVFDSTVARSLEKETLVISEGKFSYLPGQSSSASTT